MNFLEIATELNSVGCDFVGDCQAFAAGTSQYWRMNWYCRVMSREALIAKIWEDVLHIDQVGVTDSFLSLGGQSLQAASIAARLAAEFGVHIPLMAVLSQPTIIELDELISRAKQSGAPTSIAEGKRSFAVGGPAATVVPGSIYSLPRHLQHSAGAPDSWAAQYRSVESALAAVTLRHATLALFIQRAERCGGDHADECREVFLPSKCSAANETEALKLADAEASRQFNLSDEPLLRALLISLGAADHLLVLNVHHIVSDGWSMGVLLKDLSEAYAAANDAREPSWKTLPASYADYAEWQRAAPERRGFPKRSGLLEKRVARRAGASGIAFGHGATVGNDVRGR